MWRTNTSGTTTWAPVRQRLAWKSELRLVVLIPLVPDLGGVNRVAQLLGRERAITRLIEVAPGPVAAYGLENHAGTPVYLHAKVCVVDDTWASTGSDNFSRRSWTQDSELSAVVLDETYARDLRPTLAAEHLDRFGAVADRGLVNAMRVCLDPGGIFATYAAAADRLDAWDAADRRGERPARSGGWHTGDRANLGCTGSSRLRT